MGKRALVVSAVVLGVTSAGCYDSSWGQAKQSQQNVARARMPETLHGTAADDGEKRPFAARTIRVRVHATPRYAAEVHDWPKRLDDTFEDANAVLVPTAGVKLMVAEASEWSPRAADDSLKDVLDELSRTDPGSDVDFVAGLVASVPRFEVSFHELGMANVPGKHLVVRAMNDARELDEIEKGFPDLSDADRRKLHTARKKHKNAAVLLHELGHALGLVHELDTHTAMAPAYDPKVDGYDPAAADLVRLAFEHRRDPGDERVYAKSVADLYRRTADRWIPPERDAMLAWLDRAVATANVPASAPAGPIAVFVPPGSPSTVSAAVSPTPTPAADDGVAPADRALLDAATKERDAGRLEVAWKAAKPLFAKYPDASSVQSFRCEVAQKLLDWKAARAECERIMTLSTLPAKPKNDARKK